MVALQLGPMPMNAAIKLKLCVSEHGGRISMDHVITMEALSMGDPDPPQGYALEQLPPPWGVGGCVSLHEPQHA